MLGRRSYLVGVFDFFYLPAKTSFRSLNLLSVRFARPAHGSKIAVAMTVVHKPFLSPSADCVML